MDGNSPSELTEGPKVPLPASRLRAQSLHALIYCERLFYLEEVEELRLADAAVYAGRRLHTELARKEGGEWHTLNLESEYLGIRGRVDCIRQADGEMVPYEHKRGRALHCDSGNEAWPSDRIQIAAYAMILEETTGESIDEGRVRYHQDNVTVRVKIDAELRQEVKDAIARARTLAECVERPPVTSNERLCARCSLAPACLPEEARRAAELRAAELPLAIPSAQGSLFSSEDLPRQHAAPAGLSPEAETEQAGPTVLSAASVGAETGESVPPVTPIRGAQDAARRRLAARPVLRMFPADDTRQSLHVVTQGGRVGRSGNQLEVAAPGERGELHPTHEIGQVVLHGFAQISTQALRLCAEKGIGVHWVTNGGSYVGSFSAGPGSVQRRIRQYQALCRPDFCLGLARRLAEARILSQLRFLLRATRSSGRDDDRVKLAIDGIRKLFPALSRAAAPDELRGVEGRAGAFYFSGLPALIDEQAGAGMRPSGRSRRPPRDPFNAVIGFGYALLLKDVMSAITTVGLDPSLGFYHQPRSQAHPLALDLIELFRVPMVDLPVVASINRRQWDAGADFVVAGSQVWLSDQGRARLIELYERRKADEWKHPVLGYSLSYSRLIELEVRLLEKEWTGEPGLFARMRLR